MIKEITVHTVIVKETRKYLGTFATFREAIHCSKEYDPRETGITSIIITTLHTDI